MFNYPIPILDMDCNPLIIHFMKTKFICYLEDDQITYLDSLAQEHRESRASSLRRIIESHRKAHPLSVDELNAAASLAEETMKDQDPVVEHHVPVMLVSEPKIKTTKSVEIHSAPEEITEVNADDHLPIWQRKFTEDQFNALSDREKWIVQTSGKILTARDGGEMTHLSDTYSTLPWPVLKKFHALLSSRLPDLMKNCPLDNMESLFDYLDYYEENEGATERYLKRVLELREEAIEMTEFEF